MDSQTMVDFQTIVRAEIRADVSVPPGEVEGLGRDLRAAMVGMHDGFYDYAPALVVEEFRVEPGSLTISFVGSLLGALILAFLARALFGDKVEASFTDAESGQPVALSPGFTAGRDIKFFIDYLKLNGFPGHYYHPDELSRVLDRLVGRYEPLAA